jgi:hypothetical protein
MSTILKETSYLVSSDVGLIQVRLRTVVGYDVEDIIQDKAISQARAVQLLGLGKLIDQSNPTSERSVPSLYLNNDEELES